MARLITIYWRDIPSRVVARRGRESIRRTLSLRFQRALDRAAMRAGKGSSKDYIDDWRRESMTCNGDLEDVVAAHVADLDARYSDEQLDTLARNSGRAT